MKHPNSRQTKDTASGFNSANVSVKSKIQNENYQINRLRRLKNTELNTSKNKISLRKPNIYIIFAAEWLRNC